MATPVVSLHRLLLIVVSLLGLFGFSLASVQAATDDLFHAETAALTRAKGAVATRDEKRIALVMLLQRLLSYVQSCADAEPEHAASIIETSGMAVKRPRVQLPRVFSAKPGAVSGSVKLVAPQAANRAGYEWGYSLDGAATWESLPFTVQANTTVSGLKPGATVHFRYRAVTKDGAADWNDAATLIVD